ncbi:MAG: dihydroorotate dehydrogenase electron transfer subunit [Victivallaceae bacterium]|nr:dihydroorotate dehydrogenase electron transfer subunit [Victivallaceae bacterium]
MKTGEIISNKLIQGSYFQVDFYAPEICRAARPGHFVHVQIANLTHRILRRPFSICDCSSDGALRVLYKCVGEGTTALSKLQPGTVCDLMGPLGNPFLAPAADEYPILVNGGYGAAATFMLTKESSNGGLMLLGARSASDLLLVNEYEAAGFEVRVATNDGTAGHQGLVTDLLQQVIQQETTRKWRFYACGPEPMLMAVASILQKNHLSGEISLDHQMCCGVGACFACVVKVKADTPEGWRYARSCKEGPVFNSEQLYLEK